MRPPSPSTFHSIPTRGFLEKTRSSNQFSGSPFLLLLRTPSSIRVPLLFSLFPPLFHASTVLSLIVGSILCRARPNRTQITYRRFRFNIRSRKRKEKKENERTCLVTDRNDERLRTTTIQLIQSYCARAPAAIPDVCISSFPR